MSDLVLAAIIASAPPTMAVAVAYAKHRQKLEQVHLLVNAQLSEAVTRMQTALTEIEALKVELARLKGGPCP